MNAQIDTQTFSQAVTTSTSCIAKYQDCITSADSEFTILNQSWNDPQYEKARAQWEECKKYINAVIDVLNKMKADFNTNIEVTNQAAANIAGIWGE